MVKRIFVQGLNSNTTEATIRKYFEQFGPLYECVLPNPSRYLVEDSGPDDEEIEIRSRVRYRAAEEDEVLDDELDVEPYNVENHGSFENYMRKVGEGDLFLEQAKKPCVGYAYITFLDMDGCSKCMKSDVHEINRTKCRVEIAKNDETLKVKVQAKRLFVSFFPLNELTPKELKNSFGPYGKITGVELVRDSEGPLHFGLITFEDAKSVDVILSKSIYIRDVLIFTRRAVLKEAIKIAEHRTKQEDQHPRISLLPNHTAYFTPSCPVTSNPPSSLPRQAYDLSAAAGYAPLYTQPQQSETNSYSLHGYVPRK